MPLKFFPNPSFNTFDLDGILDIYIKSIRNKKNSEPLFNNVSESILKTRDPLIFV